MRQQKNLRINRNNIANIQLDKKGQAVQVHLKSAVVPDKAMNNSDNNIIVSNQLNKRAPSQEHNRGQNRGSIGGDR